MTKKLIVNADDFGMTIEVSRGILAAAGAGLVRSASAMTNCADFEESMSELAASGVALEIGFHANLTWGRPVSDPSEIPTLVDPVGNLLPRGRLVAKALMGLISPDEAYRELWAQCARLSGRLSSIGHMNGHHHVHSLPGVAAACERVAREFGIRYVRAPREGLWSSWRTAALRRFGVFMLAASSPDYWRRRGFISSDHFGGFGLGAGGDLKGRWLRTIRSLPGGTSEIMVHPGYAARGLDGYCAGREEEIPVLADPDIREAIDSDGVEIASFGEIA